MTKSEFAFIALPISALVAPPTFAVQYLTVDEAQRAILPGQIVDGRIGETGLAQRKAIEQTSGVRVLHDEPPRHRWGEASSRVLSNRAETQLIKNEDE